MSAVKSPAPVTATGATKQPDESSLWLKLLQQNSARSINPDSLVIVLGGSSYQRKDILQYICLSTQADDDGLGELELVNNSFFEVEDAAFEVPVKINLWGFQDKILPHISQIIKPSTDSQQLAMLILLDGSLDTDAMVHSLQQRLHQAASIVGSLLMHSSSERVKEIKQQHQKYFASAPFLKNGSKFPDISSEDRNAAWISCEGKYDLSLEHFPIPVIVAVTSNENFNSRGVMSSPISPSSSATTTPNTVLVNKELQGKLRLLCAEAGASLCTLPTISQMRNSAADAGVSNQLRKYLLHRLYPVQCPPPAFSTSISSSEEASSSSSSSTSSSSSEALAITIDAAGLFVPSGLDTATLIEITTREKASDLLSLRQYLANHPIVGAGASSLGDATSSNATYLSASNPNIAFQEIESEQDWLTNLHKFLSQVIDTSPAAGSASGAGSGAGVGNNSAIRRATSAYGSQGNMATGAAGSTGGGTEKTFTTSSSSDKLSVSSHGSSDKLNAMSSASSAASSASASAGGVAASEKRMPVVSRKPSMIPPAGAANQNAKDFFSSLMSDSGKK
jgi:hypothetical protein